MQVSTGSWNSGRMCRLQQWVSRVQDLAPEEEMGVNQSPVILDSVVKLSSQENARGGFSGLTRRHEMV